MLLKISTKETWVKVHVVQKYTGWDKEFLRIAREDGLIQYRKIEGEKGFRYLLSSIDPFFLKRQ